MRLFVLALILLAPLRSAHGAEAPPPPPVPGANSAPVSVGTRVLPPFVVRQEAGFTGFSVDLWDAISRDLVLTYRWQEAANVPELLGRIETGETALAIAAISITAAREEKFDFSQPMFESGLQIAVHQDGEQGFGWRDIWRLATTGSIPMLLGLLAALILIPAHLLWLSERHRSPDLVPSPYFPGIFHAIVWSIGAIAGQQPGYPISALGRFVSAIAVIASVVFVAYVTAAVTSAMTVQQLQGDIVGPDDLPGRRVGATTGSTAATYLKTRRVALNEFGTIEEALAALETGTIEAVVFDAPVLMYHAANAGRGKVQLVGPIFRRENYGIAFPQGSPLRKRVNETLLKLRENGSYDAIYAKWFAMMPE